MDMQVDVNLLRAEHNRLVDAYNRSEGADKDVYERLAVVECALLAAGAISYGEDPFADADIDTYRDSGQIAADIHVATQKVIDALRGELGPHTTKLTNARMQVFRLLGGIMEDAAVLQDRLVAPAKQGPPTK